MSAEFEGQLPIAEAPAEPVGSWRVLLELTICASTLTGAYSAARRAAEAAGAAGTGACFAHPPASVTTDRAEEEPQA